MNLTQTRFIRSKSRRMIIIFGFLISILTVLLSGLGNSLASQDFWTRHHITVIDAPNCVRLANMNGTSFNDVVSSALYADAIKWYANPLWAPNNIGTLDQAQIIKVVDLDKDGDLDVIASALGLTPVVWFENTPTFWIQHIIDNSLLVGGLGGVGLDVADLNGDDTLDVVASRGQIVWFEWPIWTPHVIDPQPGGVIGGCDYIQMADINGDSTLDLVAAPWPDFNNLNLGSLVWYENINGTWTRFVIDPNLGVSLEFDCEDLDQDTDVDIVATSWGLDFIKWYENQNGSWIIHLIDNDLHYALPVVIFDADQDNDLDVVAGGNYNPGWVGWYKNDNFVWEKNIIGQLRGARSLAVGDIEGDPHLDLVACGFGADSIVWYQNPFVTSIFNDTEIIPSEPFLHQNYPNPFNPKTTIDFNLPKSSEVTLKIFNVLGEEVSTLLSASLFTGSHSVEWDASNLASGVYLYRLQAGNYVETRKMVLMR